MRLSSAAFGLLAALALGGCTHQLAASDPNVRGIGYVRLDQALKVHPLYPQLAQLQDAIDALNLKALGKSAVPLTPAQIAQQTKELDRELQQAQNQANALLRKKQIDYQQREQAAIDAALAAAGAGTNGNAPVNAMHTLSQQQAQQVSQQANADFQAYQRSVIAQSDTAMQQVDKQITDRADLAYRQKATQLQEQESQLGLQLSQQDAAKRLDLRMKLNSLALSDAMRQKYRADLNALDAQEAAVVAAQRKRDEQTLAAYQRELQKQTSAQIAAAIGKIRDQTQAKLQERHNEVSAQVSSQLQGLQPAPVPSNLPAATRAKLAQIDKQFKADFQADAQKTIAQYQATKSDLDAQYAALQGADGAAGGAAAVQINQLQRERDDLYNKIVAQIRTDAGSLARARGLQVVFINIVAAPGGIDLTPDVEKDIESVHQ